jgi:hypothetical protein
MQSMPRQPDGWDLGKVVCGAGMVAGVLSALSGEDEGGPLFVASVIGQLACHLFEPPVCNSCDQRTSFDTGSAGFRCPSCLRLVPKFLT